MRRRGAHDALGAVIDRGGALDRERRTLIQAADERKAGATRTPGSRASASAPASRRRVDRAGTRARRRDRAARGRARRRRGRAAARTARDPERHAARGAGRRRREQRHRARMGNAAPAGRRACRTGRSARRSASSISSARPRCRARASCSIAGAARVSFARSRTSSWTSHRDEHGYEEVWPPLLVNRATMTGTGQLPKFEDDAYATRGDELFLIPTAEVPVTNLYRDEILDAERAADGVRRLQQVLPPRGGIGGQGYARHSARRTSSTRWSSCATPTPETSADQLELLTRHAETMLERLGLPYRRKLLAAGDTGFSSAMTYDLEAWAPGVGAWLEVSSCSNFTDYQARRANIRYRPAQGREAALRSHVERIGPRVSAHDRLHPRALSERRRNA